MEIIEALGGVRWFNWYAALHLGFLGVTAISLMIIAVIKTIER